MEKPVICFVLYLGKYSDSFSLAFLFCFMFCEQNNLCSQKKIQWIKENTDLIENVFYFEIFAFFACKNRIV